MKLFATILALTASTVALADAPMITCSDRLYSFELGPNGYTDYTPGTLTRAGEESIIMSCGLMMGRADGAGWNCFDRATNLTVTLYGNEYSNPFNVVAVVAHNISDTESEVLTQMRCRKF